MQRKEPRPRPFRAAGQEGSALVLVLLLALIASAIGGTMIVMSNADHRIAANERDSERALLAARAGLSYGFYLFEQGMITASASGTAFDSFSASVGNPLEGGEFTGRVYNKIFASSGSVTSQGQVYRIESTGTYETGRRTLEAIFQIVPDAFKYGYAAFNEATLHNHSGLAGPTFRIQSTIMSNGDVSVPDGLTIDGSIVSSGTVSIDTGSTITKDIFADTISNKGTISGNVTRLASVLQVSSSEPLYDRIDAYGNKYKWYNGNSTPGSYSGSGTLLGSNTAYTVQNGDIFKTDIFNSLGNMIPNPQVNVTKYVAPPMIDWQEMKGEADKNDPTYFTTTAAAVTYMISKRVDETIGGKNVKTIRIGTSSKPEFLYVRGSLELDVKPTNTDSPGSGRIKADAVFIEGGIYVSGSFDFDGPDMVDPANGYPAPPDYYMLKINALPYCYPALIANNEPGSGSIMSWNPGSTPTMGTGSTIKMSAGGNEGPTLFNGVVFSQSEIHMHHTADAREVIRFNGAEMGWKLHNCDYFWFTYDPAVRCTRFFVVDAGTPEIVSMREVR